MKESRRDWTVEADLASKRSLTARALALHHISSHGPCPAPDVVLVKVNNGFQYDKLPYNERHRYSRLLHFLPPDLCNEFFPTKQLPSDALPPRVLMGRSLLGKPVMRLPYERGWRPSAGHRRVGPRELHRLVIMRTRRRACC